MAMAEVLTDQIYAISVARWSAREESPLDRFRFFMGGALTLWIAWQICTVIGATAGSQLGDDLPLELVVPLVFLTLLVPSVTSVPAMVAATVGGGAAVAAALAGGGEVQVLVGALCGIAAGTLVASQTDPGACVLAASSGLDAGALESGSPDQKAEEQ